MACSGTTKARSDSFHLVGINCMIFFPDKYQFYFNLLLFIYYLFLYYFIKIVYCS
uniref:ORF54b n=1 Tax=Pinus koraiensis TaxID=88728 RepID=Q85X27_PINKO|nr:ORF54b [Pinus koraiensis]AAO74038.1 ORF54b [Pinus koraiensis]